MPNWRLWSGAISRKRSVKEARYAKMNTIKVTKLKPEEEATTEQSPIEQPSGRQVITKRGSVELSMPPLPPVPIEQPTIKLIQLKKPPDVLSSWIGTNPGNICQIESPKKGTGFNTIAWREQISSKLFSSKLYSSKLYLENLNPVGVIDKRLKVTYPEVKSLAKESHWENSLPDTIFVKSAGGPMIRMAAKKMVLELLDSYQSDSKLPNKPILKETKTDDLGDGEFAIEFSVKGITQIEPIMSLGTYMHNYSDLFSDTLLGALKTYQVNLTTGVVNGFRVEEVAATQGGAAGKMFRNIEDAADDLQKALKTEIAKNKEKQKVTAGPGLNTLKKSLDTLETLQTQVGSAIKDGFTNELDTRRWQQWRTPNTLTEDQIVPGTGTEIGAGLQGPVFKYELDPALARRPVVLKYDSNGLNEDAKGAGIPELNPQQSVRAVAAFKMSEHLNLGIIPRTEVFVGTDADGRPKLGQAMQVVNGAIGQRTVGFKDVPVDQWEMQQAEAKVKNPATRAPLNLVVAKDMLRRHVKVNGKWYSAQNFPVDIDYGNPVVQKGLSDLQVFDYIIGHADRNAGNWIYEKDNTGSITGVKGIDNDDTFGEKWIPNNPDTDSPLFKDRGSKTPGIPPIVDISTALSILNADFAKDIRPLLAGLSNDEIAKAAERFDEVQRQVVQRVREGNIASMGDVGDQAKLQQLRDKVPDMVPNISRWGNETAGAHTGQNSYLGYQLAQKNQLAQQYPELRGVVPESGDALV